MNELNKNGMIDLGSDPVGEDFDPFAEDETGIEQADAAVQQEAAAEETAQAEPKPEASAPTDNLADTPETQQPEATAPEQDKPASGEPANKKTGAKESEPAGFADKPPVFEYAGATENIDDTSKTFDELRIEKSADFPELEDGKRVSWTVEYGKITKTVADPKGTSIGKMKSDIETSKEFEDSLKKRGADKNPTCKVKPRVTAQSKGVVSVYKGVFSNLEEAETAGKVISILPSRDGNVYEIRNTEMGKFITPVVGCELLSDVRAGFIPALPLIPMELMMKIVSYFRYYMRNDNEREVLVNVYWDKQSLEYVVDAPEQMVTKVSVNSKANDNYANGRYIHYMDIHSHNSMKAFFSAVDDKDEKATRLYTVIGNLQEYFPDIRTRISNGGKFCEIDTGEVFELVARPFPDDWKSKVHFRASHEVDAVDDFKWLEDGDAL